MNNYTHTDARVGRYRAESSPDGSRPGAPFAGSPVRQPTPTPCDGRMTPTPEKGSKTDDAQTAEHAGPVPRAPTGRPTRRRY